MVYWNRTNIKSKVVNKIHNEGVQGETHNFGLLLITLSSNFEKL